MSSTTGDIFGCDGASCQHGRLEANDAGGAPLEGVGRRTFIIQSAMMAAAAMLAACAAGGDVSSPTISGGTSTSGTPTNSINVNSYSSLSAVGGIAMVSISGVQLAIVRTGTSSFVALSRICPHAGGIVQQSGSGFQCPIHGAQFNSTGTWVGGQRTSNLHQYTTSFDASTGLLTVS